jgi:hypothetical protein
VLRASTNDDPSQLFGEGGRLRFHATPFWNWTKCSITGHRNSNCHPDGSRKRLKDEIAFVSSHPRIEELFLGLFLKKEKDLMQKLKRLREAAPVFELKECPPGIKCMVGTLKPHFSTSPLPFSICFLY